MQIGFIEFIAVLHVLSGKVMANKTFFMLFYEFLSFCVCYNELKAPFWLFLKPF